MAGGLLAKSGLDSIKIGGHKVPIALLAGGVALVGVIAILRARSQGAAVASVGQVPAAPFTAAGSSFGFPTGPDVGPALANISQQLTALGATGINGGTPAPAATPAPSFGQVSSDIGGGFIFNQPGGGGLLGFFKPGSPLVITGPAVKGPNYGGSTSPGLIGISSDLYLPVSYGGQTGYIWAPEAGITT